MYILLQRDQCIARAPANHHNYAREKQLNIFRQHPDQTARATPVEKTLRVARLLGARRAPFAQEPAK